MAWIGKAGAVLLFSFALLTAGCGGGHEGSGDGRAVGAEAEPHSSGEKSIEEFGDEAGGSERATLLAAFHGYLEGLATGDEVTACTHLAAAVHELLARLATQGARGGCARALKAFLSPAAAQIARKQEEGRVTRVRVEDRRGFVVFRAPGAELYLLTMAREGGTWKSTTVSASVLVPSDATLGR